MIFVFLLLTPCKTQSNETEKLLLCNRTEAKLGSSCTDRRPRNESNLDKPLLCAAAQTQYCMCNTRLLANYVMSQCFVSSREKIAKDYGTLLRATESGRTDLAAPPCERRRIMRACIVSVATLECSEGAINQAIADVKLQDGDYYLAVTDIARLINDPKSCRFATEASETNYLKICPTYCDSEPQVSEKSNVKTISSTSSALIFHAASLVASSLAMQAEAPPLSICFSLLPLIVATLCY